MTVAGRAGLIAAVLAAAVALPACGGGEDDEDSGTKSNRRDGAPVDITGVGLRQGNSTAQFANCRDWRGGTVAERYATIRDIRGQLTPQRSTTAESDLPDDAAYRNFQRVCAASFSDEFRLYKLYAHAQAFAPLSKSAREAGPDR